MSLFDRLKQSVLANDIDGVARALGDGANPNEVDNNMAIPMLAEATRQKHWKVAELLFQNGADPNLLFHGENTMLCSSILRKDWDSARFLISHGADVNQVSNQINTPLISASMTDLSDEVLTLLLQKGADVEGTRQRLYDSPLVKACSRNNLTAIRLLLAYGANPRMADTTHGTLLQAIHYAAGNASPEAITLLLKYGADINARDNHQWLPIDYAIVQGNTDTAFSLLVQGSDIPDAPDRRKESIPILCNILIQYKDIFPDGKPLATLKQVIYKLTTALESLRKEGVDVDEKITQLRNLQIEKERQTPLVQLLGRYPDTSKEMESKPDFVYRNLPEDALRKIFQKAELTTKTI